MAGCFLCSFYAMAVAQSFLLCTYIDVAWLYCGCISNPIMHVFSWSNELRLWAFSFQCGTSDIHFRHKTDIIICPCLNRTHIHARTRYKNVCCVVENAMHGNRVLKAKLVENYFRLASVQKLRKCSVVCRRTQPAELQSVVVYVLRFVYTFIARCIQ